jgi:TatD DNase family protein
MLDAADRAGLPLVIHCRQAYEDLFRVLEGHYAGKPPVEGHPRGVLHCFSSGPEDARRALGLGFLLGIDGPVTYPKNDALRQAVLAVGLDAIVLETDSPYLPPQSRRGSRNESATILEVSDAVAKVFSTTTREVALRTGRNAARLFDWPE